MSMYKLVRDDYKADKSTLHIAHTNLMMAAILMLTEPTRVKDIHSHLEAIVQLIPSMTEVRFILFNFKPFNCLL
jgi:hypothetical protein